MAITTTLCDSYKREILSGTHQYNHTYKLALIRAGATGTYDAATTSYTQMVSEEVTGSGYTAGGATLGGISYTVVNSTASIDWSDASWTSASISAMGAMIWNASLASSASVACIDFGGTQGVTSGTFTLVIPVSGTGLIRIS